MLVTTAMWLKIWGACALFLLGYILLMTVKYYERHEDKWPGLLSLEGKLLVFLIQAALLILYMRLTIYLITRLALIGQEV